MNADQNRPGVTEIATINEALRTLQEVHAEAEQELRDTRYMENVCLRDRDEARDRLAEVEGSLEEWMADFASLKAHLAEVEKERDKWSDHWEAEHEQLVALRAAMAQARDLAEQIRLACGDNPIGRTADELARLLEGDAE